MGDTLRNRARLRASDRYLAEARARAMWDMLGLAWPDDEQTAKLVIDREVQRGTAIALHIGGKPRTEVPVD